LLYFTISQTSCQSTIFTFKIGEFTFPELSQILGLTNHGINKPMLKSALKSVLDIFEQFVKKYLFISFIFIMKQIYKIK